MSNTFYETTGTNKAKEPMSLSLTSYYGGDKNGKMLQITINEVNHYSVNYQQFGKDQVIKLLQKIPDNGFTFIINPLEIKLSKRQTKELKEKLTDWLKE